MRLEPSEGASDEWWRRRGCGLRWRAGGERRCGWKLSELSMHAAAARNPNSKVKMNDAEPLRTSRREGVMVKTQVELAKSQALNESLSARGGVTR